MWTDDRRSYDRHAGMRYGVPGAAFLSRAEERSLDAKFEDVDDFRERLSECKRAALATGEYMLRLAVLEDVASNLARGNPDDDQFVSDLEWVKSTGSEWPFAFSAICATLRWDEASTRAALLTMAVGPRQTKRLVRGAEIRGIRRKLAYAHVGGVQEKQRRAEAQRKRRARRRRAG